MIRRTAAGLYCERGDFYIDPCRRVERAVVTHAHGDHARRGSLRYLAATEGRRMLRTRLGPSAVIDTLNYGCSNLINGVKVSFHPAGHIPGSAQVRVEHRGEVWVISGDYKLEPDATCSPFESVPCHTFVTESTFGTDDYHWAPSREIFEQINTWWRECALQGCAAVILAYALGKAQRVIAGIDSSIGPVFCHPAVELTNEDYRASGIPLPRTYRPDRVQGRKQWGGALVVAPPNVRHSHWLTQFGRQSVALVSGWMVTRATPRSRDVDTGFALSDHADFPGLIQAVDDSRAETILVTHGPARRFADTLTVRGLNASAIDSERYECSSEPATGELRGR